MVGDGYNKFFVNFWLKRAIVNSFIKELTKDVLFSEYVRKLLGTFWSSRQNQVPKVITDWFCTTFSTNRLQKGI